MIKAIIRTLPVIIIFLLFLSCENNDLEKKKNTIYVAGVEVISEVVSEWKGIATYWIDNKKINLTNGEYSSSATSIVVLGKDVYVVGYELNSKREPNAKYWKNGLETVLSSNWSVATGATISGNDIYIVGYERSIDGTTDIVKYWKNGVAFELPTEAGQGYPTSIKVVSNDVYITGVEYSVAKYWKNGNPVILNVDADKRAWANSIDLDGNDVYVVGKVIDQLGNTTVRYWKNGTAIDLTNGNTSASGNSICISNHDVYIVGYENRLNGSSIVKYWKNGVSVDLPSESLEDFGNSIKVVGGDVYVASEYGSYWENGRQIKLSTPTEIFLARDIFVVKN